MDKKLKRQRIVVFSSLSNVVLHFLAIIIAFYDRPVEQIRWLLIFAIGCGLGLLIGYVSKVWYGR